MFCCSKKSNTIITRGRRIYPDEILRVESMINSDIIENAKKCKKIIFTYEYNFPIINIPNGIESIQIDSTCFQQSLDSLHNGLKELNLNAGYNQPLDYLPNGLEILKFQSGSIYSHCLDNLPNTLKILEIPILHNKPINSLPDSIEELRIGVKQMGNDENHFYQEGVSIFGGNKELMFFSEKIVKLPANIQRVFIFGDYIHLNDLIKKFGDKIHVVFGQYRT